VVVLSADPRAESVFKGTALNLTYQNTSAFAISRIVFNARFGMSRAPTVLTERNPLDAGKTGEDQWSDTRVLSVLHIANSVTVWPQEVMFADGTYWVDDGTGQCPYRSKGAEKPLVSVDSDESVANPSAPVRRPSGATNLSANQKLSLIQEGKASLCTISTYPSDASITIDGKSVGRSPLTLVLLKASAPRDIYITLPGYEIFYRAIDPNGAAVPIVATLAPLRTTR
jgi:hypothetical protein